MARGRPVSNRLELILEQFTSLTQIVNSLSEELRRSSEPRFSSSPLKAGLKERLLIWLVYPLAL